MPLVRAEREGMLSLSNVQPCAMPAVSLTGESGMTPGLIPLCLGEVAAANVVAEDQAVLNCRTLLLKWPLCTWQDGAEGFGAGGACSWCCL